MAGVPAGVHDGVGVLGIVFGVSDAAIAGRGLKLRRSFFPSELAFDFLEKILTGRWRTLNGRGDFYRHREVPVDAGGVKFNFKSLRRDVITDTGNVARTNRLALDLAHKINQRETQLAQSIPVSESRLDFRFEL